MSDSRGSSSSSSLSERPPDLTSSVTWQGNPSLTAQVDYTNAFLARPPSPMTDLQTNVYDELTSFQPEHQVSLTNAHMVLMTNLLASLPYVTADEKRTSTIEALAGILPNFLRGMSLDVGILASVGNLLTPNPEYTIFSFVQDYNR